MLPGVSHLAVDTVNIELLFLAHRYDASMFFLRYTKCEAALSTTYAPEIGRLKAQSSSWRVIPTAIRPSDPALCGSCPLVTPYYCRLGDLLCFIIVSACVFVLFPLFDLSFVASFSTLILLVGSFDL